jgi:hypothetical protein
MRNPLTDLKSELQALKQKNRKFLSISRLIDYCDTFASDYRESEGPDKHSLHHYEHKMALWRAEVESGREHNRILIDSASQALKILVIVSGGASAATLAFLGSVWKSVEPSAISSIVGAMGWFSAALFGAVFSYGLSYLTHLANYELDSSAWFVFGRRTAIFIVIASYLAIGLGFSQAYVGLKAGPKDVVSPTRETISTE